MKLYVLQIECLKLPKLSKWDKFIILFCVDESGKSATVVLRDKVNYKQLVIYKNREDEDNATHSTMFNDIKPVMSDIIVDNAKVMDKVQCIGFNNNEQRKVLEVTMNASKKYKFNYKIYREGKSDS